MRKIINKGFPFFLEDFPKFNFQCTRIYFDKSSDGSLSVFGKK